MNTRHFLMILMSTIFLCVPVFAEADPEEEAYTVATIVNNIGGAGAPYISDDYVVFTFDTSPRYVGIAFDFENFREIHQFKKLVSYDYNNEEQSAVLFYMQKLPVNCTKIRYRLIIDGLWTTDRQNKNKEFDTKSGTWFSYLTIDRPFEYQTAVKDNHVVSFVYEGTPGQKIRLAGSFNNWDSFIYYLTEVVPGRYELDLPLPTGTWYYSFYSGMDMLTDPKNMDRVYTKDGRIASVITVQ